MRHAPRSNSQLNPTRQPKLTVKVMVLHDGKLLREHAFSSRGRRLIRIGRLPSVHVHLDDSSLAQCHAMIEIWNDQVTLIDLGHTGGCRLNGERVHRAKLASHDQIKVGGSHLMVVLEQGEEERPPDTRTRIFFQQLRLTPPEWIPELHRFLEYMTFRRRPGAGPARVQAPPVKGKLEPLSLVEAYTASPGVSAEATAPAAGSAATSSRGALAAQPLVSQTLVPSPGSHGTPGSDSPPVSPSRSLSRSGSGSDSDSGPDSDSGSGSGSDSDSGSDSASKDRARVVAQLARASGRVKPWEPGSRHDFYDTRRLVAQLRRERRRINRGAVVGVILLAVGFALVLEISRGAETASALLDTPTAGAPADTVSTPRAPLPADDGRFVYRWLEAGQSLERFVKTPTAPVGYAEQLGRHNPTLVLAKPVLTRTVVKLPRFVIYRIKRGDSLGVIAERLLGDRRQVALIQGANRDAVPNPSRIEVGMELRIPVALPAAVPSPPSRS